MFAGLVFSYFSESNISLIVRNISNKKVWVLIFFF